MGALTPVADEPDAKPDSKRLEAIMRALIGDGPGQADMAQSGVPGGPSMAEVAQTWFPVQTRDGKIIFVPQLPPGPRSDAAQRITEEIMKGAALSELAKERGQRQPMPDNLDARSSYAIERGKRYQGRQSEDQRHRQLQDRRRGVRDPNFGVY